MKVEEAIARAEALGIGIGFTEHLDYEGDTEESYAVDPKALVEERKGLREKGVLIGIEAGLTLNTRGATKAALDVDLDFIVGSVHVVDGYDIFTTFWQQGEKEVLARKYLGYVLLMIERCPFFDSLGHIDYPSRYCPFPDKEMEYEDYKKEYDLIFEALLDNGKILELNTRRFMPDSGAGAKSLYCVLDAYKNMGGKLLTLGSDAHEAQRIGHCFDKAYEMANHVGLQFVRFVERKPVLFKNAR
jgi:histidinol-phosphatase (PHP family)